MVLNEFTGGSPEFVTLEMRDCVIDGYRYDTGNELADGGYVATFVMGESCPRSPSL